jgi:WD40 repeat protein
MLFRSNILALVGGGAHPKFPPNKVILWDDHQMKCIGEVTFKSDVKGVRLRKDRIITILEQRIYIYQISDLKLLDVIDTCVNALGLCALTSKEASILICPSKKKGYIRITNYDTSSNIEVKAHESSISNLSISQDGRLCATASDKGTLIRVFSTADGKLMQELRRGTDKAGIKCISFDKSSKWLACTSDKGTVHIFSLAETYKVVYEGGHETHEEGKGDTKNPTSVFKFMKGLIPYFNSEWSFAQFRIHDSKAIVAFGPEDKNCIIVVSYDGKYYQAEFDAKTGGECKKVVEKQFIGGD